MFKIRLNVVRKPLEVSKYIKLLLTVIRVRFLASSLYNHSKLSSLTNIALEDRTVWLGAAQRSKSGSSVSKPDFVAARLNVRFATRA